MFYFTCLCFRVLLCTVYTFHYAIVKHISHSSTCFVFFPSHFKMSFCLWSPVIYIFPSFFRCQHMLLFPLNCLCACVCTRDTRVNRNVANRKMLSIAVVISNCRFVSFILLLNNFSSVKRTRRSNNESNKTPETSSTSSLDILSIPDIEFCYRLQQQHELHQLISDVKCVCVRNIQTPCSCVLYLG